MNRYTAEQRAAQTEIAALERAQTTATEPDARRMLDDERNQLMAAAQRRTGADLAARTAEARRVRLMWS